MSEAYYSMLVANAALKGVMHLYLSLAKRGLVSPDECQEAFENNIIKELDELPDHVQGNLNETIVQLCAQIKMEAAKNWKPTAHG